MKTYEYAEEQQWLREAMTTAKVRIKVTNDDHIVTFRFSHDDGKTWTVHGLRMEVSGIHHNVLGGFLSLRIGVYSAGEGSIRLRDFRYRGLNAHVSG